MKCEPINWGNPVIKIQTEGVCGTVYTFLNCIRIEKHNGKSFVKRNVYYAPDGSRFDSEESLIRYMETGKKPRKNKKNEF